jgi:hypothetical protein
MARMVRVDKAIKYTFEPDATLYFCPEWDLVNNRVGAPVSGELRVLKWQVRDGADIELEENGLMRR